MIFIEHRGLILTLRDKLSTQESGKLIQQPSEKFLET